MTQEFIERVFDSMMGLPDIQPLAGVEVILREGNLYYRFYEEMMLSYGRLRQRLGVTGEDSDVEEIIDCLMCMSRLSGYEMFRYGMRYGKIDGDIQRIMESVDNQELESK